MLAAFLRNHPLANLTFGLVLVAGFLAYGMLPRQQDPTINFNWIVITTILPGASAQDVEKKVTDPLEDAIRAIGNMKFVSSTSRESVASLLVRFDDIDERTFDKRLADLRREIQNKANAELPAETLDPVILEITTSNGFPTAMVVLTGQADDEPLRAAARGVKEDLEQIPGVEYFLGLRPRDQVPPFEYMEGRMEKSYGDIKLTTIPATDAGVGMVIEVDGLTIFHAGDHTNGKDGMMTEFSDEIDYLKNKEIKPDICFMVILGCSLGNPPQVRDGVIYTLETLKPKVFIPMHAQTREKDYRTFVDGIKGQFESIQMAVPGNRGDHFVYSKGKLTDPRGEARSRLTADSGKTGKCATSTEGCSAR